ncbi:hypothetical protein BGW38_006207 [Lunasporangiospora selenospora]|uniref:Uncharacterized protein n=1 Tax=Lunasporangiospora selenospora TaxID=979761 RepID=A0A9P6FMV7_9FUNG|nr:hypothetical protein BGW38_006207 [Lunasporangiospora selenospora]
MSTDTTTTPTVPATAAPTATESAIRAKATIDKRSSILFKIKLQDAQGKHVPVYEVASKMIGSGRYAVCQELSVGAFEQTLKAHPRWLAVPYNDPVRLDILNEWQTKGVPCLHIYDPVRHEILTSWGGSCLRFNPEHCHGEWRQGEHGVSYWQMLVGWWYYRAPEGVFRDVTEEELIAKGPPHVVAKELADKKDK